MPEDPTRWSRKTRSNAKTAARLVERGATYRQAAIDLGISEARVCQYLKALGVSTPRRGPRSGPIDPARRDEVLKRWGKESSTQIARTLGCSVSTIENDAHALGLPVTMGRFRVTPKADRQRCQWRDCGAPFTPRDADAAAGNGRYCSDEHFRIAQQTAHEELDAHPEWMKLTRAAQELKLEYMTLLKYGSGRGHSLPLAKLQDVPELEHLAVTGVTWVVRRADVKRLAKDLRAAWRRGIAPSDQLRKFYGAETNFRWDGRLAWEKAEQRGLKIGPKPLVEPGNSDEREILARYSAGESQRAIADAMSLTRMHVRGALKRHGLAA